MKPVGLRAKLIFMVAGVLALAISMAALMIRDLFYQNDIAQKVTTVNILTASLVHDFKYNFQGYDQEVWKDAVVGEIISKYMTYYRIIRSISFYDPDLIKVADSNSAHVGQSTRDPDIMAAISSAKPSVKIMQSDSKDLGVLSIAPILQGSRIMGAVVMDISIQDIEAALSSIERRIAVVLIITVLLASLALLVMLRNIILIRLNRLMNMTREIAAGNYKIRIEDPRKDEIGQLSQAFNHMTSDLQRSKQELEEYHSKNLEEKVRDATAQLEKAYKDLKNAQGQIVLKEKMASLGILIAGIAHEINTPVGAISNISRNLKGEIDALPGLLRVFKEYPDVPDETIFACLKDVIEASGNVHQFPSHKEIRAFETFLRQQGIENWRQMSSTLVNLNFLDTEKITRYLECFRKPYLFHLVESMGSIAQAAKISESSGKKIQEIVQALKYYAYTDKDKVEMIQINESVHTALILFRNKLKYSINVETEWDQILPLIPCTSDIHQVWTNLLSNACDAIEQMGEDYVGKMSVRTLAANDRVMVMITDNGIGIPQEKLGNIFDPFFTTKDIGKGTGLGLSIVSGVIKKHNGTIQVENHQDHTTFTVSLPLKATHANDGEQQNEAPANHHEEHAWQNSTVLSA